MRDDIIEERRRKLDLIRRQGVEPFPARVKKTISASEILKDFSSLSRKKAQIHFAGRVTGLRDQGGVVFLDISDWSGAIQAVLLKSRVKNLAFLKSSIDIGDIVAVSGALFITKKGEKSIEAARASLAAKSLRPFPSSWYGLKDVEERFRKKYLDIALNAEVKEIIIKRSEIVQKLRLALYESGFMEVETPVLQPIAGGARAAPFVTHHRALNSDFYLRIAPELYLKRLLVAGLEKIFEIGRVFRNEGIDRDHNPEFTMLELYWAYQDFEGLMKFTEKIIKPFIARRIKGKVKKFSRMTFEEAFKKYAGRTLNSLPKEEWDEVFKHSVRHKIEGPLFLTHYPKFLSPLAKSCEKDQEFTERFQLIVRGMEIVNAFSELNDPIDQRQRMEAQEKLHNEGDKEASRVDEEFLEALEYGMPPASGLGIGIDRLVAVSAGADSIKETIIFPTLRPKK